MYFILHNDYDVLPGKKTKGNCPYLPPTAPADTLATYYELDDL